MFDPQTDTIMHSSVDALLAVQEQNKVGMTLILSYPSLALQWSLKVDCYWAFAGYHSGSETSNVIIFDPQYKEETHPDQLQLKVRCCTMYMAKWVLLVQLSNSTNNTHLAK